MDYAQQFGRRIPDLDVEVLSWSLRLATVGAPIERCPPPPPDHVAKPASHVDVIDRARKLFDKVIVAVAHNDQKQPLFTLAERLELLQGTIGKLENVEIAPGRG